MGAGWPREGDATRAVDAAARAAFKVRYDETVKALGPDKYVRDWDDLTASERLAWRQSVLAPVWAALEALPDPRHWAWEEGLRASFVDVNATNPYPSGL